MDAQGQLWARGEGIMCGYFADPQATQTRIQDGWLATGDLVERDELGHYRLRGRLSEVIVLSTGFKVSPELIESRLANLPCIDRVLVVGEDQPYLVALIWPDWSTLPSTLFCDDAREPNSLNFDSFHESIADSIRQDLADLPTFMHPRKIIVMSDIIRPGSELITPKGSLRRKLTIAQFQMEIDEAYS
jgi:long-chain acyl-CoA synthetase